MLSGITPHVDVREIGDRLLAVLSRPISLDSSGGDGIVITPSIGIAISNGGDDDPSDLLSRADVAMYQAKRAGKHTVTIYNGASDVTIH